MFEGLKKKLSELVGSFAKKESDAVAKEEKRESAEIGAKEAAGIEAEHEPIANAPQAEESAGIQKKEHAPAKEADEKGKEQGIGIKPKISFATKAKGLFVSEVKIKESDIDEMLEQLRLVMLQADVNYDVAERFTENLRHELVGKSVSSKGISDEIRKSVNDALLKVLSKGRRINIVSAAREKRQSGEPFRIVFIGPNGAGKTTTIAKIAHMLLQNGLRCVLAAADTFRAAAIEQTAIHAERLGVDVIKGKYGADPASIAFDAIAFAKAHAIDVVLIDTAGRQETNKSLIEEVKKMVRVAKPDLKIFVGEGIAGNAILDQVKEFDAAVGLDGIILTKLDVDAKGGSTLSILSDTTVPILFLGTGEGYEDIEPYDPEKIVKSIAS